MSLYIRIYFSHILLEHVYLIRLLYDTMVLTTIQYLHYFGFDIYGKNTMFFEYNQNPITFVKF